MSRARFPILAVAVVAAAVIAVVAATSGASTNKASQAVAAGSAISLKQTSLGQTLADANGRTLYLFEGDKRNVSTSVAGRQGRLASVHGDDQAPSIEWSRVCTDRNRHQRRRQRADHL